MNTPQFWLLIAAILGLGTNKMHAFGMWTALILSSITFLNSLTGTMPIR